MQYSILKNCDSAENAYHLSAIEWEVISFSSPKVFQQHETFKQNTWILFTYEKLK